MAIALVAIGCVLVVGLAVYLAKFVQHPEQSASHGEAGTSTASDRLYGDADRPAGPDVDDFVTPDDQAEADGAIRSADAPAQEHPDGSA